MSDVPDHAYDEIWDEDDDDGPEPGEECGRWDNGRLTHSCAKAGTEECDFECPYRNSLRFAAAVRAALSQHGRGGHG